MKKIKIVALPLLSLLILSGCNNQPSSSSSSEHTHTYSLYWAYNESHHWHEATCGHKLQKDNAAHTFSNWFTTKEPTITQEGEAMRQCSICHYTETKKLEKKTPEEKDPISEDIFNSKQISCDWAFNDYNIDTATRPFWNTKTVYNETLTFADKNDTPSLLYTPSEIVSVYDYALKQEYIEGEDFIVNGNKLELTKNTRIKYWGSINPSQTLYMDTQGSITIQSKKYYMMSPSQTKYIFYSESVPNYYQLNVTYKTIEEWDGYIPTSYNEKFINVLEKLENKERINIALLGDSISFGRGSSSDLNSYFENNTPCYANLFYEYLLNKYPQTPIVFDNQAVGGTTASWGATKGFDKLINVPDLLLIAFGMNDDGGTADSFIGNINNIISKARTINPECEILLVSSMLDNPDRLNHDCHLKAFEDKLIQIANVDDSVGVATMTSMTKYIYENTGVRFEDVNSNNYNHPNNFIHRLYAQVILNALLGEDFTPLTK